MNKEFGHGSLFHCTFFGKNERQVAKLISGPNGIFICDECVDICADIIEEEFEDEPDCFDYRHRKVVRPGL